MTATAHGFRTGVPAMIAGLATLVILDFAPRTCVPVAPIEQTQGVRAQFLEAAEQARAQGADAFAVALSERVNPPGDTVFMRHPDLIADEDDIGARLALSSLAMSSETRLDALATLEAEASEPLVVYRVRLERARVLMRIGRAEDALMLADALWGAALDPKLKVDALFVAAHAALESGAVDRAETALALAVEHDRAFFNARQSYVLLLARHLPRLSRGDDGACLTAARRLLENAAALPSLAGSERRLFLDLADALSRLDGADHPARAFAAGTAFAMAGDKNRARARLTDAATPRGVLPPRCEATIAEAARAQMAVLEYRS